MLFSTSETAIIVGVRWNGLQMEGLIMVCLSSAQAQAHLDGINFGERP